MLSVGDTFYIPLPGSDSVPHLWIVVTQPGSDGIAVCVNVTSRKKWSDLTTILKRGDHSKITEESCVFYAKARLMDLKKFEALVKLNSTITCKTEAPCSHDLLKRIRSGLLESLETPKEIKELCRRAWTGSDI